MFKVNHLVSPLYSRERSANSDPSSLSLRARHFFDLPDFLTWKATGGVTEVRSLCSLVCKWTYEFSEDGDRRGWNRDFFNAIGLDDLAAENFVRLGLRAAR